MYQSGPRTREPKRCLEPLGITQILLGAKHPIPAWWYLPFIEALATKELRLDDCRPQLFEHFLNMYCTHVIFSCLLLTRFLVRPRRCLLSARRHSTPSALTPWHLCPWCRPPLRYSTEKHTVLSRRHVMLSVFVTRLLRSPTMNENLAKTVTGSGRLFSCERSRRVCCAEAWLSVRCARPATVTYVSASV